MDKKGIFYGVSVGPGDPELMTLKAVRVLQSVSVIAAPQTKSGAMLALDIAKQAVDLTGKTVVPLFFTMEREANKRREAHQAAAEAVRRYLDDGVDVAMLNIGDVSIYATYSYIMELLQEQGYCTQMIAGVPSFCAVAARLGVSLTEPDQPVHIVPGSVVSAQVLPLEGTKILMKSGKQLPQVLGQLEEHGQLEHAVMVCNCGLPDEKIYTDLTAETDKGYFATIVVKE